MPRRKKTVAEKRCKDIKMALTEAEYTYVSELAAAVGEPAAVYCRHVVIRNPPMIVPPINEQVWSEMGVPLGNLNQLLRLFHLARAEGVAVPESLFLLIEAELLALRAMRSRLKGEAIEEIEDAEELAP